MAMHLGGVNCTLVMHYKSQRTISSV